MYFLPSFGRDETGNLLLSDTLSTISHKIIRDGSRGKEKAVIHGRDELFKRYLSLFN